MSGLLIDELTVRLGLTTTGFIAGIAAAKASLHSFSIEIADISAAIGRMSKNFGESTESINAFGNIMAKYGGSAQSAQSAIKALGSEWSKLKLGMDSPMRPYLQQMGIDPRNNPLEMAKQLADVLSQMPRNQGITLAQSMGFDEATATLLVEGRKNFEELLKKEKEHNLVSILGAANAQKLVNAYTDLNNALYGLERGLLQISAPFITGSLEKIESIINSLTKHSDVLAGSLAAIAGLFALKWIPSIIKMFGWVGVLSSAIGLLFEDHKKAIQSDDGFFPKSWWLEFDRFFEFKREFDEFINMFKSIDRIGIDFIDKIVGSDETKNKINEKDMNTVGGAISKESIFNFYKSKGMDTEDAAAMALNIMRESGGNSATSGMDTNGHVSKGLVQWQKDRVSNKNYLGGKDVLQMTPREQLEYSWWEMHNTKKDAYSEMAKNQGGYAEAYKVQAKNYFVTARSKYEGINELELASNAGKLVKSAASKTEVHIDNINVNAQGGDSQDIVRNTGRAMSDQLGMCLIP